MENPEKIEIEGLKTIHKLCKFGADHNMEGCTFTEIVERMFSKIEQMKTQVNTLDEMLLNQGEALAQAKAQAVPEGFGDIQSWIAVNSFSALDASIVDFPVVDANELAEFIDSLNIDVAVPEGFVLVKKELPEQIAEKMAIDRIDKPRHENDPVWREIAEQSYKDQVKSKKWEFWRDYKAMIEAQEPAND
ncbi:hypothetical protein [Acinetobacter johnsonii]|uniref:hypothetical protein n=1 Tax=Acinetobacter johnsonii TaxID=40214 RepID=UPI00191CFAF4|nr:hypothetical protein [Acinetobacter johnsonii]QQV11266.1 hypothetical protein I6I49_14860 [Acinetobacter johnsonii]